MFIVDFFSYSLKHLSQYISLFCSFSAYPSSFKRNLYFLRTISNTWMLETPLLLLVRSCFLANPSASVPNPFQYWLSRILECITSFTLGSCKLGHFSCKIILASEKCLTCFSVTTWKRFPDHINKNISFQESKVVF